MGTRLGSDLYRALSFGPPFVGGFSFAFYFTAYIRRILCTKVLKESWGQLKGLDSRHGVFVVVVVNIFDGCNTWDCSRWNAMVYQYSIVVLNSKI